VLSNRDRLEERLWLVDVERDVCCGWWGGQYGPTLDWVAGGVADDGLFACVATGTKLCGADDESAFPGCGQARLHPGIFYLIHGAFGYSEFRPPS
jgi:hypothetical protein